VARRVTIRRVAAADEREFIRLARLSIEFHRPWIHAPTTAAEFKKYLVKSDQEDAEGFLVRVRETEAIAGFINLNEIVLGPYRRGLLGYGAFMPGAGQGFMAEGLEEVTRVAFDELGLHRLEADIQPGNRASLKLVEKAGFRREGLSPGFIFIDGQWKDHERWAKINARGGNP
jgi:ribosomal-protein-alanine N-acetyltransferase